MSSNTNTQVLQSDKLQIGQVVGYHGVKGAVKVKTENANPDWLETLETAYIPSKTGWDSLTIVGAFQKSPHLAVLTFQEITSRTDAERRLAQKALFANEADLPTLEQDEFRLDDLVGLQVLDAETQAVVGIVKGWVTDGGHQHFLEIAVDEVSPVLTVPFNGHFFPAVDVAQQTITARQIQSLRDVL